MSRRDLKGWTILAALLAFVGYFGVWRLWTFLFEHYGIFWATAVAALAAAGFAVIAVVGAVMVRSRPPDESRTSVDETK